MVHISTLPHPMVTQLSSPSSLILKATMGLSLHNMSVKTKSGRTTIQVKTPMLKKKYYTTKKRAAYTKMTVGSKTPTSYKFDVRICGDSDVADVFHHMETEMPVSMTFLIFGETDKMYGGFKDGRMGEYFSVKFIKGGGFEIKDRVDWEEGIEMVNHSRYSVWYVQHKDLVDIPGYTYKPIRI